MVLKALHYLIISTLVPSVLYGYVRYDLWWDSDFADKISWVGSIEPVRTGWILPLGTTQVWFNCVYSMPGDHETVMRLLFWGLEYRSWWIYNVPFGLGNVGSLSRISRFTKEIRDVAERRQRHSSVGNERARKGTSLCSEFQKMLLLSVLCYFTSFDP